MATLTPPLIDSAATDARSVAPSGIIGEVSLEPTHSGLSLHGANAALWQQLPLPLAEIGSKLDVSSDAYVDDLLRLAEASVLLALCLGLSRVGSMRPHLVGTLPVGDWFRRPSFGLRHHALEHLERLEPGVSGWDLRHGLPDARELVTSIRGTDGSRGSAPRVGEIIAATVQLRNELAHHRRAHPRRQQLPQQLDRALTSLILSNVLFRRGTLLYVDRVEHVRGGRYFAAMAFKGPVALPYRKGALQPAGEFEAGQVYLRVDADELVPVHPFLVSSGTSVFVMDEMRADGGTWRRPSTSESCSVGVDDAALQKWFSTVDAGVLTLAETSPPPTLVLDESSANAAERSRARSFLPYALILFVVASTCVLSLAVLAVLLLLAA